MELLRALTLIYAAVLVLALAASLVAILVYLRRIGRALADARAALAAVPEATEPLGAHLEPLRDACRDAAGPFDGAARMLEHADERLGALAERLGAGEPTP